MSKRPPSGAHRVAVSAAALALMLGLQACSFPGIPGSSGAPQSTEETQAPAAPAPEPVNELAEGSTSHRLGAASHTLILDYWTNENPADWTPESSPIISVSLKVDGNSAPGAIRVTRFNTRIDALGVELTNDQGSFALEPPYAYTSGFALPSNPGEESTTVLFTIDLLTETAPGSGVFTRQTVLDTLTIGYPGTAPDGGGEPAA
ncbi:hypothetical protein H9639_02485 [Arthrobacter sp. Sa2CUA1]|uniref:Lipoprotein n=1 Tax=Arthrobacter gallicola TaxID=2762225 RepID=A0ABR8UNN6_9MICC|nr:hypothetical protein [Arthrobacter gallicola]MBD7994162.1 hypothetical protein [Arthrobacter gallicola]